MFNKKNILITGGTGSFGSCCARFILKKYSANKVVIFSRDELKQYEMQKELSNFKNLRFLIGDIRDQNRLNMAFKEIDYVIHAAALKHVPSSEYNPFECVQTNIVGGHNVINAAILTNVKKVIALSTDKATNPLNLYGASKLCLEKLFVSANVLTGKQKTFFSVVRYGNVINSRGSVLPFFSDLIKKKEKYLPITDINMTRFFFKLEHSVKFVLKCLKIMKRGEVFIPKLPSCRIIDLVNALKSDAKTKIIGIRPGEKIHEMLYSADESRYVREFKTHYVLFSQIFHKNELSKYKMMKKDEAYSSLNNKNFFNLKQIKKNFLQ